MQAFPAAGSQNNYQVHSLAAVTSDFILSLSKIKSEHADGAIRRELISGECAWRPEQSTVPFRESCYSSKDFITGSDRYDMIFDTVGKSSLHLYRPFLAPGGTYVTLGRACSLPSKPRRRGRSFTSLPP
jgi:Zinc-binding dehydrogenase